MPPRPAPRPAHPPAQDPAVPPCARGDQQIPRRAGRLVRRQPLLLPLALGLFLLVGVPILILVTMPAAHADDSSAPASDAFPSEPVGDPEPGNPPDLHTDTQDDTTPTPPADLVAATAGAQQTLTATQPEPGQPATGHPADSSPPATATATDPGSHQQGSDSQSQTTPDLLALGLKLTPDRQRTPAAGDGDGDGEPPPGSGHEAPTGTWTLSLELAPRHPLDATEATTTGRRGPPPEPTAHEQTEQPRPVTPRPDQDPDLTSLVIASGNPHIPATLQVAYAGFPPINRLRGQAGPDPFTNPGNRPLLVRFLGPDSLPRRDGGPGGPASSPPGAQTNPDGKAAAFLDPATRMAAPLAAALAGWGPITIPPTPTSGASLERFLRTIWDQRQAILDGRQTVYGLYTRRAVPRPDLTGMRSTATSMGPIDTPWVQLGSAYLLDARVSADFIWHQGFIYHSTSWRGSPENVRYQVLVNATPERANDLMSFVVREGVEDPRGGLPVARLTGSRNLDVRRDTIEVWVEDREALERFLLRTHQI